MAIKDIPSNQYDIKHLSDRVPRRSTGYLSHRDGSRKGGSYILNKNEKATPELIAIYIQNDASQ